MFINKLTEQPNNNPQKMSSYLNSVLKTEITCIPRLLSTYLGNYYNNALCNGATWIFMLWCLLHTAFDKTCNAFLKILRYREYVRLRLKSSLWYLGFFGTAVVYCGATLTQNEVELFNFKKMHVLSNSNLPMQVIMGYTLICTFYLHSAFWEGLSEGNVLKMASYFCLFGFMVSSYILRIVEISFTLTALISVAQVALEFTRCCFMASIQETLLSRIAVGATYIASLLIYLAIHVIVIPLTFIIPLGIKIMSDYPNTLLIFLFFNLVLWLVTEFSQSIVFKLANHWLYHKQIRQKAGMGEESEIVENASEYVSWCSSTLLECSLFKPRDDDSYNLMILREEMKARKDKMLSMRKPKNMFLQTLKCMVAIKRKLSEKRHSDSSDSDSERSENSDLRTSENTDDDMVGEDMQSEDDSDNEESDSQEEQEIDEEIHDHICTCQDAKDEETKENKREEHVLEIKDGKADITKESDIKISNEDISHTTSIGDTKRSESDDKITEPEENININKEVCQDDKEENEGVTTECSASADGKTENVSLIDDESH